MTYHLLIIHASKSDWITIYYCMVCFVLTQVCALSTYSFPQAYSPWENTCWSPYLQPLGNYMLIPNATALRKIHADPHTYSHWENTCWSHTFSPCENTCWSHTFSPWENTCWSPGLQLLGKYMLIPIPTALGKIHADPHTYSPWETTCWSPGLQPLGKYPFCQRRPV